MPAFNYLCLCVYLLGSAVQAQSPAVKIQQALTALDESAPFKRASWGFCLVSGKTGMPVASIYADKSLIPASTQKLITTAAALTILGDTFRFRTSLQYDGKILPDGTLIGNIYIKGGGDPVLGSLKGSKTGYYELVKEWSVAVKRLGIKKIQGALIADESLFDTESVPPTWIWLDIANYYGAGTSALSINENMYELYFRPGKKPGDTTQLLRTEPTVPGLILVNKSRTTIAGGDQTYLVGAPYTFQRTVIGTMPSKPQFSIKGSLPDPALFCAQLFSRQLITDSIRITQDSIFTSRTKMVTTAPRKTFYIRPSPPLPHIVQYINYQSNNLAAEHCLKMLGLKINLDPSLGSSIPVIEGFLSNLIKNKEGIRIADGSGLSKYNTISAGQMAEFLYNLSKQPVYTGFLMSLPRAGSQGTLEKFCDGTPAEGKILGKSGTMQKIKCYAGYIKGKDGTAHPFSILVNNFSGSSAEIVSKIEYLMNVIVASGL